MRSDPRGSGFDGPDPVAITATGSGPSGSDGPDANHTDDARDLARAREQLLAGGTRNHRLDAPSLRHALVDLHEFWLTTKGNELGIRPDSGFAIVAVGGLGRREMMPYSDLDLILLHDDVDPALVAKVADQLWYPLWDAHIKLDHSVRTVPQALQVAASDLTATLGMLEARRTSSAMSSESPAHGGVRRQWRTGIRSRFDELVEQAQARWAGAARSRTAPSPTSRTAVVASGTSSSSTRCPSRSSPTGCPGSVRTRPVAVSRWRTGVVCSTSGPNCIGWPGVRGTSCERRMPTRSARRCGSETASISHECSATAHARSGTRWTWVCAPPATRCPARGCRSCDGCRCVGPSTRGRGAVGRAGAGARCATQARSRSGGAGCGGVGVDGTADLRVHAGATVRQRARAARTVAQGGAR